MKACAFTLQGQRRIWVGLIGLALLTLVSAALAAGSDEPHLALTPAEKAWLQAHPRLVVGYDPAWLPLSFTDAQGRFTGLDADLLAIIARRTGLRFEAVTAANWTEVYARAIKGEVDLLAGTARTPERERRFHFTEPYLAYPIGIITRSKEDFLWSMHDLADKTIAGPPDYATTTELRRLYPEISVIYTETMEDAIVAVSKGRADAAITNLANASFIIKTRGLTNLKIVGIMPETLETRFAVRPDWPELVSILNKAIASLTRADMQALEHRWIRVDYAKVIRWDLVWRTALGVLAVFATAMGVIIWHNRSLRRELELRIRLQREIEQTHTQLKRVSEDRSALLRMAAHDLRGPLTSMQLAVDTSLRLHAMPGPDALALVDTQIKQMTALLNDLLDLEAIEEGHRRLVFQPVDCVPLLRVVLAAHEGAAIRKGLVLSAPVLPGTLRIQADELALRQIIDNLVSNALKFTPGEGRITVSLAPDGTHARLEVRDEGPGVPLEERERIFTKYARGSAHPTGGEKSTGLGLSIVRELANAMNGRVWCEAPPEGRGARFICLLPLAPA